MQITAYRKSIGMMLGLIVGAGIFALPAAVARAGIWWGALHFGVAFTLMLMLQLWFAEIAFLARKPERFPGFVRRWLGKKAERVAFLSVVVGYYGALLAYGILGGIFLHALFPIVSALWWTLIFFALTGALTYAKLKSIGSINFYLTVPLVLFVVLLGVLVSSDISFSQFRAGTAGFWFLPYGIFIFAFGGIAAIPEVSDLVRSRRMTDMRNVIFISMATAAILYAFFIFSVVGVMGDATTDDALTGLAEIIGRGIVVIGAIIGFLAVITSNLSLAADMKNIFRFDYNVRHNISWILTVLPAPLLFLAGMSQFLEILSFVGAVVFGISGILIFLMARSFHKKHPEHRHPFLSTKNPTSVLVLVFLIAGVVLELLRASGVL